jgi:hypothetical protein
MQMMLEEKSTMFMSVRGSIKSIGSKKASQIELDAHEK